MPASLEHQLTRALIRAMVAVHFIEDVPGQLGHGAYASYGQQLSVTGRDALVKAEAKDNPAVTQEVG